MTDEDPTDLEVEELHAEKASKRISSVWIIPLVAVVIGGWLVWNHYHTLGPLAEVTFATGEGLVEGKTRVECRSVEVGQVETLRLNDDLASVAVTIRMKKEASHLLRKDARFWVVRPRVGGGGVSGLGTIVSGSYIELDPGSAESNGSSFVGLEQPPVTAQSIPGLRIELTADEAAGLSPGSPVNFRGISVGKIESRELDFSRDGYVTFGVYFAPEYAELITENTRFWNTTGIRLDVGADGISLETGSLESLVAGGVEFGVPDGEARGKPVRDGASFTLLKDQDSIEKRTVRPVLEYLLLFKNSVRGLSEQAPVEFRGIQIGQVAKISFDFAPDDAERRVPVLIEVDPSMLSDQEGGGGTLEVFSSMMDEAVTGGLRATLKTGSLLTGQLFVDLDFYPDEDPAAMAQLGNHPVIPTRAAGLARIEDKLMQVLDHIQKLPLGPAVDNATTALASINTAVEDAQKTIANLTRATEELDKILSDDATRQLPAELRKTLATTRETLEGLNRDSVVYEEMTTAIVELRKAARTVTTLADTIERQPNSLIFGSSGDEPEPPKGRR
ncbi:MAG: paraquat-inducible protein B [Verrucomicrobiales bacterium]|jgi:paraquat-inducible protein B